MHRLLPRVLLLTLALAANQWLMLAHASMHPALADNPHCEMCVYDVGLDGALPSQAVVNEPTACRHEAPTPQAPVATRKADLPLHAIRGPPSFSDLSRFTKH